MTRVIPDLNNLFCVRIDRQRYRLVILRHKSVILSQTCLIAPTQQGSTCKSIAKPCYHDRPTNFGTTENKHLLFFVRIPPQNTSSEIDSGGNGVLIICSNLYRLGLDVSNSCYLERSSMFVCVCIVSLI